MASAIVLSILLGVVDYFTGPEIALSIFYVVPIALAAWFVGRTAAVLIASLCGVVWLAVELIDVRYTHWWIPFWNMSMRLVMFVAFGILFSALRRLTQGLEETVKERTASLQGEIEERRHAEESAREAEERFASFMNNSPMLSWIKDTETWTYSYVNNAFERGFEQTAESVKGKTDFDLFPSSVAESIRRNDLKALQAEAPLQLFEDVPLPDRVMRHWLVYRFPLHTGAGKALIAGSAADFTERKQAEEHIVELNAKLEQRVADRTVQLQASVKELEAFAYSVSHDLRTPLRSIDGFSKEVLEQYGNKLDPHAKSDLERVRAASQHMGRLIDDLLNLSRLTRSEMTWQTVDLSAVAEAVAAQLQKSQPERKVQFLIASGLKVQGDANLLRIALDNLLINAWKFSRKRPEARIEFGQTISPEGEPVYFVRDNGAGFDMTYVNKLFGPFQRLHVASEFEGTGIGLTIVQRIVQRHGGRVWAEGAVGKGATFYFTLTLPNQSGGQHETENYFAR